MHKKIKEIWEDDQFKRIATFVIPLCILAIILISSWVDEGSQQFALLAKAFLHGQLNFLHPIGGLGQDPVYYHGRIYWDEGAFPAILLMPFVAIYSLFGAVFYQGYIQFFLILGVIYFVYKLARIFKYSKDDSLILMLGFVLGSVFMGVASISSSWFFAQVVTTFLLFWAFYEFYTRKRWLLIGLICGFIVLTRTTAAPILIFFLLELWQTKTEKVAKFKKYKQLLLPVLGSIVLMMLYNLIRFNDPLQAGFKYQLLYTNSIESRNLGLFSLVHLPSNLFTAFFQGPNVVLRDSSSWTLKFPYVTNRAYGMSLFITSPYLLYFFSQKLSSFKKYKNLIIAILVSAFLVFSFWAIGAIEFGYRYALDFLPGVYVLLMLMYKDKHARLTRGMKFILLLSGVINFYFVAPYIF